MRTFVISDLHLGNGGPYEAFAAPGELPAFLDRVAETPTRIFVNGDGVDFLMNEDPLELDRALATAQAKAIVEAPSSQAVLRAFGRVLKHGGEVVIRLGNHDVELALPEVQAVIRGALDQPPEIASRLSFQLGDQPAILDVGGARILVTHGEHNDKWNQVDYRRLAEPEGYVYTAGSRLVKQILNPLTRDYGMRFMNFLKPDFQGGALTGLAVSPSMVKVLLQKASLDIGWQLWKRAGMAVSFDEEDAQPDLGLAERLRAAGLTDDERAELEALLGDGALSFGDEEGLASKISVKIARAALEAYAGFQRGLAGNVGDEYFRLDPDKAEWDDAVRLSKKFGAGAVIIGHTHAARWKEAEGITFANTGTWIWLMQLPAQDAGDEGWADFLTELKHNPKLAEDKQKHARTRKRFTAVSLAPREGGGAAMSLVQWDGNALSTLGETRVPAAEKRP